MSAPAGGKSVPYTLYCFAQSGHSYKVALMLEHASAIAGQALWQPREVDYFGGETRTPAYAQINPMREVPVLEHADGRLAQSAVILDWLTRRPDGDPCSSLHAYGARDDRDRDAMGQWLLFDNHKFTSYTATYRFLRCFATAPDPAVLAFFRGRAESAWSIVDERLQSGPYVMGNRPTIVDFSMAGYVFYGDELGLDFDRYPAIGSWMARLRDVPGWRHPYELMPGRDRAPGPSR